MLQALGTSEAIRFRRAGIETATPFAGRVRTPLGRVPHWFVDLLGLPEIGASFPVRIDGKQVGDILSSPDLSADIYEKWVGFLALVSSAIALMLVTGIIAYLTAGTVVDALRNLGEGLTRMRTGDYQHLIAASGPPEIRKSSEQANELARTLNRLSQDNRSLLRKIVSLQDDERRDIARDLHDELGPLLFGIRANAVALQDGAAQDKKLGASVEAMLKSVEALQLANRRILDRLRPLHIQELGLEKSVQTLLQYARSQAPGLKLNVRIDPASERRRWAAFPDHLPGYPGRRDQCPQARQCQRDERRGDDRRKPGIGGNFRRWRRIYTAPALWPWTDGNARARPGPERDIRIQAAEQSDLCPVPFAGWRVRRAAAPAMQRRMQGERTSGCKQE